VLGVLLGLVVVGFAASHIVADRQITAEMRAKLTPAMIASAKRWARHRGLPVPWVLATILVESEGKVGAVGDEGGRSVGLMQVNTVAHAAEMQAAGVTRSAMFGIDKNIEWGTAVLKDVHDKVKKALAAHPTAVPVDIATRLAYKGPKTVLNAITSGQNPITLPWAPLAVVRWRRALTGTSAVV
jgi:hypothetical protein